MSNFIKSMPLEFIWKGILGGMSIGIAALCFLKGGKLIGAALFAFGLSAIILGKWKLFTGESGFADYRKPISTISIILLLLCNAIGVVLASSLGGSPEAATAAQKMAELRFSTPWLQLLGGSVLCGFIMTVSVQHARKGNWLPLVLGIPTFVICGFPHCVADICYYTLSGMWGLPWLISIIGNFIGCNVPTLFGYKGKLPLSLKL